MSAPERRVHPAWRAWGHARPDAHGMRAETRVPASSPQRLVSLAPSNTEILCALGLGACLVGVDDDSDYPAAITGLPRVGRDLRIDVDRVAALAPDLVVASLSVPGMERNIDALLARGLPFMILDPRGLPAVFDSIRQVGAVTGVAVEAARLVASLEQRVAAVRTATATLPAAAIRAVYWEWWPRPPIAPGRQSWITDMLALAGGRNIFGSADAASLVVDDAAIRVANPAVAIASYCGARKLASPARLAARPGWDRLAAVQTGQVYTVLEAPFGRPGPRLVEGLELLCGLLHPGLLPAADALLARRRHEVWRLASPGA